jgi:hypothetical protein
MSFAHPESGELIACQSLLAATRAFVDYVRRCAAGADDGCVVLVATHAECVWAIVRALAAVDDDDPLLKADLDAVVKGFCVLETVLLTHAGLTDKRHQPRVPLKDAFEVVTGRKQWLEAADFKAFVVGKVSLEEYFANNK